MTQPRKPLPLRKIPKRGVYAGIGDTTCGHPIYVGGDYYGGSSEVQLFADEALRLGKWLIKAAEYLKQREVKGKKSE